MRHTLSRIDSCNDSTKRRSRVANEARIVLHRDAKRALMLVMHDLLSLLVCQERIAKETSSLDLAKVV